MSSNHTLNDPFAPDATSEHTPNRALEVVRESDVVVRYALDKIRPGKNARTEFDAEELEELGASMLETQGTPLQPLVGIPDPDGSGIELIAGERRWRAAQRVGILDLPVMHRKPPTEKERLKWGLIENLQRVSLKPLEQARGIVGMLELTDEAGNRIYTTRTLADELGKPFRFISTCEALMHASNKLQKAVNDGLVNIEVGALIGILPQALHERAEAEMVFRPAPLAPMNRDEARRYVAENFRRDLRRASFPQDDATLVPGMPACNVCPYWGGLREDVTGRAKEHTCLNPACFEQKQAAAAALIRSHAEEQNTRVLTPTESARIFERHNNELAADSGFVELSKAPDAWMLKDPKANLPAWDEILEGAPLVIAFDTDGKTRRLVETKVALAAVKENEKHAPAFKEDAADTVQTSAEKKDVAAVSKAGNAAARAMLLNGCVALHERLSGPWNEEQLLGILRLMFRMARARCAQREEAELLCRILQPDLEKISNPYDQLDALMERETVSGRVLGLIALTMMVRGIRFNSAFHVAGASADEISIENELGAFVDFSTSSWDHAITIARHDAEAAVLKSQGEKAKKKTNEPKGLAKANKRKKKDKAAPQDPPSPPPAQETPELALGLPPAEAAPVAPVEEPIENHPDRETLVREFGASEDPESGRLTFRETLDPATSPELPFAMSLTTPELDAALTPREDVLALVEPPAPVETPFGKFLQEQLASAYGSTFPTSPGSAQDGESAKPGDVVEITELKIGQGVAEIFGEDAPQDPDTVARAVAHLASLPAPQGDAPVDLPAGARKTRIATVEDWAKTPVDSPAAQDPAPVETPVAKKAAKKAAGSAKPKPQEKAKPAAKAPQAAKKAAKPAAQAKPATKAPAKKAAKKAAK